MDNGSTMEQTKITVLGDGGGREGGRVSEEEPGAQSIF